MKESPISDPKPESDDRRLQEARREPDALGHPILCLVVDRTFSNLPLEVAVAEAADAGVDWIQLRERELVGQEWLEWALKITESARQIRPEIEIIVNRRLDVALAVQASGIHLGFDSVSPSIARHVLGSQGRIGVSIHSSDEARQRGHDGADYFHLAPVFDPLSKKPERPALGLKPLQDACATGIPILAQGGITAENTGEVIGAGASGIAVTGNILASETPGKVTSRLRQALDSA